MTLTTSQLSVYNILLGMCDNSPLTDDKRALLLSVDLKQFGISDNDKKIAVRHYEHIVGLTLQAA
jgi:hypothetical protein